MPLIFLPPTFTLEDFDLPSLCDFDPDLDLSPCDLQDATQDAGRSELGLEDLHTEAGALPMASSGVVANSENFISLFFL